MNRVVASAAENMGVAAPHATRASDALRATWGTARAVATREVLRMVRDPARPIGVVIQPVVFWLLFGTGLRDVFALEGAEGVDYATWFYPGAVAMTVLFSAIFGTITVVEDRQAGFLQSYLVAPGHRAGIALGKVVGVGAAIVLQVAVFLLAAAVAGHAPAPERWPLIVASLGATTVFVLSGTVLLAWWSRSTHAYHAVMSALLLPSWVLSGAMFPPPSGWLGTLMAFNPMTWHVDVLRGAFGLGGASLAAGPVTWVAASTVLAFGAMCAGVARVRSGGTE